MIRFCIRYWMIWMLCACAGTVAVHSQTTAGLPEFETQRLLNGLEIIVAPTTVQDQSMTIGLVVRYGSAFDGANKSGVAHFLSRMFARATNDKTRDSIRTELENLGATLQVQCNWDGFKFLLKGNSANFEQSLLLLYQVVCELQFPEEELDAVKREILEELQQAPDPRNRLREMFEIVLFGGTTYGRTLKGTSETVQSISAGDLKYYYERHFSPNAASLVLAGNVDPSRVLEKASRIWGLWIRKELVPFTFAPARESGADIHLVKDAPGSSAVEFILGNFSPRRQDPVFGNVRLATSILQQRLRERLPTSLVSTGLDGRRMPGIIYVQGQAAAEDSVDQILEIEASLDRMKTELVSSLELAEAQNRIIEEFAGKVKTTDGLCEMMMDTELYRLGIYYIASFPDRIRNCTADSIRQAARDYFLPGKKVVILQGPVKELLPDLKRLGDFKQIAP